MISSPAFGAILVLGLLLLAVFLFWLLVANLIYEVTLGPKPPASIAAFARDVFTTSQGWTMIVVGMGVGFLFALLVFAISVVSFPLLLDRDVGLGTAISTSIGAVAANPGPMAVWGLIVAGGLVIGSIPAFLGLIFVLPVLGHATWHLYRKVVEPSTSNQSSPASPTKSVGTSACGGQSNCKRICKLTTQHSKAPTITRRDQEPKLANQSTRLVTGWHSLTRES